MTGTTTSPRPRGHIHPPSSASNMNPFLSPRISSPHKTPSHAQPTTPSPNYFGFQAGVETNPFIPESPHHHVKRNFSPPSSTVRSTAAASPGVIPVDQNSDFDAFRRESEGKAFNLGGLSGNFQFNSSPIQARQRAASKTSSGHNGPIAVSTPKEMPTRRPRNTSMQSIETPEMSRSPKRVLSPGSINAFSPEPTRRMSPSTFPNNEEADRNQNAPRFSLPLDGPNGPFGMLKVAKADSVPQNSSSEPENYLMVTPQHVVNLLEAKMEEILILDLRVSTQYAMAHIDGALSLCIPTTLLKRPSFNVQKLAETFKDEEQRKKFENWRSSSAIIVYDSASSQLKDAQICVNTIKKFKSEGYEGTLYIVRGGFAEFCNRFSNYVADGVDATSARVDSDGPEIAPVIGGCPMPINDKPANPFFGNIRQNMDLIGGVGQIALKRPATITDSAEQEFPDWLRQAAEDQDQGKKVSDKFEAIERREKKRMEDALSGNVSWDNNLPRQQQTGEKVQIAGIEKGNKNRYNNIWPFEHSRVKLQGIPSHDCDYFNANFIQADWSHKRYISTQAPIPATFNDFWNVVWQQDVRVIVMLTAEQEGAQVKAHNYWDKRQYGSVHLEFLSERKASLEPSRIHKHKQKRQSSSKKVSSPSPLAPIISSDEPSGEQPFVIVRKFGVSHERKPFEPMREVTQLQYSSWPDFGAPAHPAHLLGLVEQTDAVVRATNGTIGLATPSKDSNSRRSTSSGRTPANEPEPANSRPVMVHCSAGCGRTGTFCTVDSVIDMLKRQHAGWKDKNAPRKTPNASEGNDFFSARPAIKSANSDPVTGTWVNRIDQDLVEKTVEDFRLQRLSMVQSLRQYVLCYESVMEWLVGRHEAQE